MQANGKNMKDFFQLKYSKLLDFLISASRGHPNYREATRPRSDVKIAGHGKQNSTVQDLLLLGPLHDWTMGDTAVNVSRRSVLLNDAGDLSLPLIGAIICCTSVPDEKRVGSTTRRDFLPLSPSI